MSRPLVWSSLALLGAVLLLLTTRPPEATLWVQPPDEPATSTGVKRCPRGTLEDLGVCVPVPVPEAPTSETLPLVPGRPSTLESYGLPVSGAAELLPLVQSPLPESWALDGDALVVRPTGEVPLLASTLQKWGAPRVLDASPEGGWLLLLITPSGEAPAHLVALSGLKAIEPGLTRGNPLPAEGPIARVSGTLWFAARQLRPGVAPTGAADAWIEAASIATDPRNVLPTKPREN